ncbi:hypothetical protein L1987_00155 [Smallanthus sonchifolius]|uniref:Uncharacterized protein n=1 Tax=Smallanthus sonchifolius TaxID=185202 RepID=A0ACB9K1I1_9ASTR|nr:hypothetical protein L1987_00155 [Smallanthus sonchifolius]
MIAKARKLQHELGCLSEHDSWLLFKKFAFAEGREGDDVSELEPIGREIVEKCKRLPLAVKTLGSLMWTKRSTREEIDLLPHLKRCFAYCCLFPKGYQMKKDAVIQLWVVNGFIPPREEIDLYELGEEIFNCLVWRSFFQVVKDNTYIDNFDRYKMHDLIHDMAQHVMGHECLVIEPPCNDVILPNEVFVIAKDFGSWVAYSFVVLHQEKVAGIVTLGMAFMPPAAFKHHFALPEGFYVRRWQVR